MTGPDRAPGGPDTVPGRHRALLYDGAAEFRAAVGTFIHAGVAAGEPVLVTVPPRSLGWIRQELHDEAPAVQVADAEFYHRPGRATRNLTGWLRASASRGRARVVAEYDLTGRPGPEIAAYLRAEAAANVIYRPFAVSVLCPFGASLPQAVLDDVRRTHPGLVHGTAVTASPSFTDPARFIRERSVVPAPPPLAASMSFERPGDLGPVRSFLRSRVAGAGLGGEAAQLLITAVGEVVTNALAHGRAPRRLWVYPEREYLVCHVHDSGPGPADPLAAYLVPEPGSLHGHGLWLARQIGDFVELASDRAGTHVRVLFQRPAGRPPAETPARAVAS